MGDSLSPSAISRLAIALRPDWSRTVAARRALAAVLVVLAAVAAWRDDPHADRADVVIAVHDLGPGVQLSAADVRRESRRARDLPEGALIRVDEVVGATLAGPMRQGEIVTDVRVLGPRLAEATLGPDTRIVPLPLADAAVVELVRVGDVVDIVAAPPSADVGTQARLIATDAVVVLVSPEGSGPTSRSNRVVLVALPAAAARTVAGAALVQAVTVTLH
ncbi:SAF domain-containing protein [Mycobacterium sp. SMC-4]|uniref:SAF domain-containing protein n=1 Tax=Mycobacterium sp. SMC-4 TaxID=2857059 RepID=UPI0021B3EED9|nr:SAF domain-containing protein [Mycobacterium sp. SMC-4]UXA17177.1 SAF domain-containing protein [Mycobacterium sp. SMC-4]